MKRLIVIIVLVLAAIFFGYKLSDIEGRIIIDLAGTIVQLSLLGALIFIVLGVLLTWLVVWLITRLIKFASGSRSWLGALSSRQHKNAFFGSIKAMLINEHELARQLINKTSNGDFNGVNFLIAAELERQAGNTEKCQANLIQAMDYKEAEPIALIKQAELHLQNDKAEEAMNVLSTVEGKVRDTKAFVLLKMQVLKALDDWPQIQTVAKENKKLLGDDYIVWAQKWTTGEFAAIASKDGAKALQTHWEGLSRAEKRDHANQVAYVQLLISQGMSKQAEEELLNITSKQSHHAYWDLFKQLNHSTPTRAIKFVENEIKKHPNDAVLYSVLANIAYNMGDYSLAQKALYKALELGGSLEDKALLAKVLEHNQDYEKANELYRGLLR